jgi:hypothetical protein
LELDEVTASELRRVDHLLCQFDVTVVIDSDFSYDLHA